MIIAIKGKISVTRTSHLVHNDHRQVGLRRVETVGCCSSSGLRSAYLWRITPTLVAILYLARNPHIVQYLEMGWSTSGMPLYLAMSVALCLINGACQRCQCCLNSIGWCGGGGGGWEVGAVFDRHLYQSSELSSTECNRLLGESSFGPLTM